MERGSLVGGRAMSGQVKKTDREGRREMCVQGSKRTSGGGAGRDGLLSGGVMDVEQKMDL